MLFPVSFPGIWPCGRTRPPTHPSSSISPPTTDRQRLDLPYPSFNSSPFLSLPSFFCLWSVMWLKHIPWRQLDPRTLPYQAMAMRPVQLQGWFLLQPEETTIHIPIPLARPGLAYRYHTHTHTYTLTNSHTHHTREFMWRDHNGGMDMEIWKVPSPWSYDGEA